MLAAMPGELQRAAGAWQAEWETLSDLLRLTGASLSWTAELVDRLEVDTDRTMECLVCDREGSWIVIETVAGQASVTELRALRSRPNVQG